MARLPNLSESDLTEEQKPLYDKLAAGRGVRGPFNAWLRNPEFAEIGFQMGDYLRFRSTFSKKLGEFAISIATRHWTAQYAFNSHSRQAMEAGIDPEIISAVIERKRPLFQDAEEEAVYDFCHELMENHAISDSSFNRALDLFGEKGVVDLIALCGYYSLVSMTLVAANVPVPEGVKPPLPD